MTARAWRHIALGAAVLTGYWVATCMTGDLLLGLLCACLCLLMLGPND